jgi:hypothetical protein
MGVRFIHQTYPLGRSARKLQYELRIDFNLHERSSSIFITPRKLDIHADEEYPICEKINALAHSIKSMSERVVCRSISADG